MDGFARSLQEMPDPDEERVPDPVAETITLTAERRQLLRCGLFKKFQTAAQALAETGAGGADIVAIDGQLARVITLRNELAIVAPPGSKRRSSLVRLTVDEKEPV